MDSIINEYANYIIKDLISNGMDSKEKLIMALEMGIETAKRDYADRPQIYKAYEVALDRVKSHSFKRLKELSK